MYNRPSSFTQPSQHNVGLPRTSNENKPRNSGPGGGKLDSQAPSSMENDGAARRRFRNREFPSFKENTIDNYFWDLKQKLKNKAIRPRIQAEIASSRLLLNWVREGLDEFRPNEEKNKSYENHYKGKPHLNLSKDEIGLPNVLLRTSPHSEKIELLLNTVVTLLAEELSANSWVVAKVLRKHLRAGQFYPSLYSSWRSNEMFEINPQAVDRYFKGDSKEVNENSLEFQTLLAKCTHLYFEEFYSCILCLEDLLEIPVEGESESKRGIPSIIAGPSDGRPIGCILWDNYAALADNILKSKGREEEQVGDSKKKMRQVIALSKCSLFNCLVQFFVKVAERGDVGLQAAEKQKGFWETVLGKLDEHMREIEGSMMFNSSNSQNLNRLLTQLLVSLFPWHQFYNDNVLQPIKDVLSTLTADSIRPIQMLLLQMDQPAQIKLTSEIINKSIEDGNWLVHSYHWKKWLGLLLKKLQGSPLSNRQALVRHLVWLCKATLKVEFKQFWTVVTKQEKPPVQSMYLWHIGLFLKGCLDSSSPPAYQMQVVSIFPILTASLGSLRDNFTSNLLNDLVRSECFKDILRKYVIEHLINSLKLEEKSSKRPEVRGEEEREVEQQIKFLCRMIEIGAEELEELEMFLFDRGIRGLTLVVFLCRLMQQLQPQTVQDIKCLRYIIKALDAIFLNPSTRTILPLALGSIESSKWPLSQVIKQIVDLCAETEGTSEVVRQSLKLRKAISTHLYHIVSLSASLDQYFPSSSQRWVLKLYDRLDLQLKNEEYQWIRRYFFSGETPLRTVSWFHFWVLILKSSKVTMLDLQVTVQLIHKFRVEAWVAKEYGNLEVVLEVLNKGRLVDCIISNLTPMMPKSSTQSNSFLSLLNSRFQSFLSSKEIPGRVTNCRTSPKYASKHYRALKIRKSEVNQINSIYGEISSSLRVLETLLQLNIEGDYSLLKRMALNEWMISSLAAKGFLYSVPFTAHLEKKEEEKPIRSRSQPKLVEYQLTTSVNLVHTIASLLDFERRLQIGQHHHPSWKLWPSGILYSDVDFEGAPDSNVLFQAQLSILAPPLARDSISGSVLKILSLMMVLGWEKQVLYSINNRNYPQNKALNLVSAGTTNVQTFLLYLMDILSRASTPPKLKEQCLQFLCIGIRCPKFRQLITAKLPQYKEPFLACLDHLLEDEGGLTIMTHLLMFLNLVVGARPSPEDIRFVKGCLGDLLKLASQLQMICSAKLRGLKGPPDSPSPYQHLKWNKTAKQCLMAKLVLLLFLGIVSVALTTESEFVATRLFEWMLEVSPICLQQVPPLSLKEVSRLGPNAAKLVEKAIGESTGEGLVRFVDQLCSWCLFECQGSLGEEFVVAKHEVFHSTCNKQKDKAHKGQEDYEEEEFNGDGDDREEQDQRQQPVRQTFRAMQVNMLYSLHATQEVLSQFYSTVVLGVMLRGNYGYHYYQEGPAQDQNQAAELSMCTHAPNGLSRKQVMGKELEALPKVFKLVRHILSDIWRKDYAEDLPYCKNSSAMLLSELIQYIAQRFVEDPITVNGNSFEAYRILDSIQAEVAVSSRQVMLEDTLVLLTGALLKLAQGVYISSKVANLTADLLQCYLGAVVRTMDNVLPETSVLSTFKVYHIILDQELSNLQVLESDSRHYKIYLNNPVRKQFVQKLGQAMVRGIALLDQKQTGQGVKMLAIHFVAKVMQIAYCTREPEIYNFLQGETHRLCKVLEVMAESQGESQDISGLFVANLLAEANANSLQEWVRLTARVLNCNNGKMLNRLGQCGSARSLWAIVEAKHLLAAIASFQTPLTWTNNETSKLLSSLFVEVQKNIHRLDPSMVIPEGHFERTLALKKIRLNAQSSYSSAGAERSVFSMLAELRLFEMVKYLLVFLFGGLSYCPLVVQFSARSIELSFFEEHIWERLKLLLENACDFMLQFQQHLSQAATTMVSVNSAVCLQAAFSSLLSRTFFESYRNESELVQSGVEGVSILACTVQTYVTVCRNCDWKSRLDWQPSRKALLAKCTSTLKRWEQLAKKYQLESGVREVLESLNSVSA